MVARGARRDPARTAQIRRDRAPDVGPRPTGPSISCPQIHRLESQPLPFSGQHRSISESGAGLGAQHQLRGSYRMTPESAERSSVRSVCGGRPIARFEPWPRISSGLPALSAHCTASSTSRASRALRVFGHGVRIRRLNELIGRSKPRQIGKTAACRPHMQCGRARRSVAGSETPLPGLSRPRSSNAHLSPLLLGQIDLRRTWSASDRASRPRPRARRSARLRPRRTGAGCRPESSRARAARLIGVVEDERMQITVAAWIHVGDSEPMGLGHFPHAWSTNGSFARGRCHPCSNSPARCARPPGTPPAAGPEQEPLRFRAETRQVTARHSAAIASMRGNRWIDLGLRAVELDDQQRLDIERIAGMDELSTAWIAGRPSSHAAR